MKLSASRLLASAAAFAAAVAIASPAQAQRVTRIVALGDSYIDDGNVYELTGTAPNPIYPLRRFSNGLNLVDTLSQILNAPVLNYGVGGAVARAQNTPLPQVQAFDLQVQSFLAGGGPAAFPRSSGHFEANDLLLVNIGGNDARAYERQFGATPTAAQIATLQAGVQAQAQLAAGDAVRNLNALVAAGARNLSVLGGDTGFLPEVRGTPVAAVGSAYSNTYNGLVRDALAGYAANGAIVNYIDLTRIGQQVDANPGAYGLISSGACPTACVTTNPDLANSYLFYVDALHLTQAGYAIVGRYAARQLEAPLQLEAQGEAALGDASAFSSNLQERLNLGTLEEPGDAPPFRLFLTGDYGQLVTDDTDTSNAYRLNRHGVTGGVEYQGSSFIVGLAGRYSGSNTDFRTGTGSVHTEAEQIGAYAHLDFGNFFVEGYGGIGRSSLDIRRTGVINDLTASPDADLMTAGAQVGYLFDFGKVKIGPTLGVDYARAKIDGYTETGDGVLTLNVQEQEAHSTTGSLGLEMDGDFSVGGAKVSIFLTAEAVKPFDDDPRTIRYALTAAPTIVNSWNVGGGDEDSYARLGGGANLQITHGITVQASGSTTIGQEGGDDSRASVGLRVGF
jgi:outer membrane lipase/esterase